MRGNTTDVLDFIYHDKEVKLNYMYANNDKSLLALLQDNDVYFLDTSNYRTMIEPFDGAFQNVRIVYPFYRSQILFVVGNESNKKFKCDRVSIWDASRKKEIGGIQLSLSQGERINKLYVNRKVIFIILTSKILLFDLMTLKYIMTFEDVPSEAGQVSISSRGMEDSQAENKITLAYVSNLNPSNIKIFKFLIIPGKDGVIVCLAQQIIGTDQQAVQFISVSSQCKFLAAVAQKGRKINIYSMKSYKARNYLWRGSGQANISSMAFDRDDKFMVLLSSNSTFHIYPLLRKYLVRKTLNMSCANLIPKKYVISGIDNNQSIANENSDDDQEDYYLYGKRRANVLKGFFKKFRNIFGKEYKESFAKMKDDSIFEKDILLFYFTSKLDLIIFDKIGNIYIVKFNRKKGGQCWIHQKKHIEIEF